MKRQRCKFRGCHRPVKHKGMCNTHYYQWYRGEKLRAFIPRRNTKDSLIIYNRYKGSYRALVRCPEHPFANSHGRVYRSRLVMERKLGRYLKPHEVVHHKNSNSVDDRPRNLFVYQSHYDHLRGERSPNAKISRKQAKEIIKERKLGLQLKAIKRKLRLPISMAQIARICRGENWTFLSKTNNKP